MEAVAVEAVAEDVVAVDVAGAVPLRCPVVVEEAVDEAVEAVLQGQQNQNCWLGRLLRLHL